MTITTSPAVVRATLLSAAVLCGVVLVTPANAIRFDLQGESMGHYDPSRPSQFPEWRVGVFSEAAAEAKFAPGAHRAPYVDVDVTVASPPHYYVELFIYRFEAVQPYPDWRPCNPVGQTFGAQLPPLVDRDNARRIVGVVTSRASSTPSADNTSTSATPAATAVRVAGRVNLTLTGLYVLHLNACRFAGSSTQLDVNGWHAAIMTGVITVRNPYGGIPGQGYGYLPSILLCFVLQLVAVAVTWIVFYCSNPSGSRTSFRRRNIVGYHLGTTAMFVVAAVAYLALTIYFGHLNSVAERNSIGLYRFALATTSLRNTVIRVLAFLFAVGHNIVAQRQPYVAGLVAVAAVHACLGLITLWADSVAGVTSPAHAQILDGNPEPAIVINAMYVITAVIETGVVVAIAMALRRTFRLIREQGSATAAAAAANNTVSPTAASQHFETRRRRLATLYRRFAVMFGVYVVLSGLWWLGVVAGIFSFSRLEPASWKLWWVNDMGFELLTAAAMVAFGFCVLPFRENLRALSPGTVMDLSEFEEIPADVPHEQESGFAVDCGANGAECRSNKVPNFGGSSSVKDGDDDDVPMMAMRPKRTGTAAEAAARASGNNTDDSDSARRVE